MMQQILDDIAAEMALETERGKVADFIAWDIEHPSEIVYWLGGDLSKRIIQHGKEILI